jgi:hypothetical protein
MERYETPVCDIVRQKNRAVMDVFHFLMVVPNAIYALMIALNCFKIPHDLLICALKFLSIPGRSGIG